MKYVEILLERHKEQSAIKRIFELKMRIMEKHPITESFSEEHGHMFKIVVCNENTFCYFLPLSDINSLMSLNSIENAYDHIANMLKV